jgi:hypothetical protein
MAAEEVIDFPLWAQLSRRPCFSALSPPEPVAEPPPWKDKRRELTKLLPSTAAGAFPFANKTVSTLYTPCGFGGPTI